MINSVQNISNVSFKAAAMDKLTPEMISHPGKYSKVYSDNPITQAIVDDMQAEKKKGSLFGKLVKFVLTLAVLAGAVVATKKYVIKDNFKALEECTTFGEKAKCYFAKTSDFIEKNTWGKFQEFRNRKNATDATPAA